MAYGKMTPTRTRTRDGKRVDVWTFNQADAPKGEASINIDVVLHANSDGMLFEARSAHPLVGKRTWTNSDINVLRKEVEEGIQDLVAERASEDWVPSVVLETDVYTGHHRGESVQLTLKTRQVRASASGPDNRGIINIIEDGSQKTLVECHRGEELRDRMSTQDLKRMTKEDMALIHADQGASRVVLPAGGDSEADVELLKKTVKAFSDLLAQECGPSNVGLRGVPTGDRLVELMQNAVQSIQK